MAKTVSISDELAALLEKQRKKAGYPSLDAAAEALIAHGMAADDVEDDHLDGRSVDVLRALIDEAEASGTEVEWNPEAVRAEILRRYAARGRQG